MVDDVMYRIYSNCIMLRMALGMKGGMIFALRGGSLDSASFLSWLVVLIMKEKARLSRRTMAAIWAKISDLEPLRTLGLSMILRSSFKVLFARSEADLNFLIS